MGGGATVIQPYSPDCQLAIGFKEQINISNPVPPGPHLKNSSIHPEYNVRCELWGKNLREKYFVAPLEIFFLIRGVVIQEFLGV